jgi:hypothetical protein
VFERKVYKPGSDDKNMSRERDDTRWLNRGKQRAAVARSLIKPMTAKELCERARRFTPRIQLRDVWHLMNELQARGLAFRRNPRLVTGRLYELTPRGMDAVEIAFGEQVDAPLQNVDWRKYSHVARAKIRRITLIGLGELEVKTPQGETATGLRKHLIARYPVGLNPVIRAIRDLRALGLVKETGVTEVRCCKQYQLTPAGARIVAQLKR